MDSAGRVALGDEDADSFLAVVLGIVVVDAAVAQFAVVQTGFLGALACQLRDTGHGLTLTLTLLDLVVKMSPPSSGLCAGSCRPRV
jgi:hypothetical protein